MDTTQLVVIIFAILYASFIIFTRKKGDFEEFAVAGRSLGFFFIFASICASYIGPGWTLGLTREGYSSGMFMSYIIPLSGLGLMLVGLVLVPSIREKFQTSYSLGDLVGGPNGHNHRLVHILTGLVSLLFVSALTIAMSYAGGELVNNVFGFSKQWSIIIVTSIVIVYSYFGGIRATIQTDAIQFVHFIILIPILAGLLVLNDNFTWSEYWSVVHVETSNASGAETMRTISAMVVLWLFGAAGIDSNGLGRYLAAKDAKTARNATVASGLFIGVWIILMIFIGSVGFYLYPNLMENDQVLLNLASNNFSGIIFGIFIIAMIGVVMSSQDTLLNSGSVLFSEDIVSNLYPNLTEMKKLTMAKGYTIFLGIVSILVASYLTSVLDAIMIITEYYIPIIIPVVIFSILKTKCYWQSALISMLVGFISFLMWENFGNPSVVPTLILALGCNIIAYIATDYYLIRRNNSLQSL